MLMAFIEPPIVLAQHAAGRQIPSPIVKLPTNDSDDCDDRAKGVGVMANHF